MVRFFIWVLFFGRSLARGPLAMSWETVWVPHTWRKTHCLHFIRALDAMSHRARGTPEPMSRPDLNLLATLDVLLTEGSVARAAKRLSLSPSAMSRTLARLRETTGDPLLVRAGRGLVPSPRALELR